MSVVRVVVAGIIAAFVGFLLNVSAGVLDPAYAPLVVRWGWFVVVLGFVVSTIFQSSSIKTGIVNSRLRAESYLLWLGSCCVLVLLFCVGTYFAVNAVWDRLSPRITNLTMAVRSFHEPPPKSAYDKTSIGTPQRDRILSVPLLDLIYVDHQFRIYNRTDTRIMLWGTKVAETPRMIEKHSRTISPSGTGGFYYYIIADLWESSAIRTIGQNREERQPFLLYLADISGRKWVAEFSIWAVIKNGTITAHTQSIAMAPTKWKVPSIQEAREELGRCLLEAKEIERICGGGPTPDCIQIRNSWEAAVTSYLNTSAFPDSSYANRWKTGRRNNGVPLSDIVAEEHVLDAFISEFKSP